MSTLKSISDFDLENILSLFEIEYNNKLEESVYEVGACNVQRF